MSNMNTSTGDVFTVPPGQKPLTEATAAKVGFRELSSDESDLVKECRDRGEALKALITRLETSNVDADRRWVAIAKTHFQEGLMACVRAVTKPAFF